MILAISEARKQFNALVSANEVTVVSRNGKPSAAIVPYEQYRAMYQAWKKQEDEEVIERANRALAGKSTLLKGSEVQALLAKAEKNAKAS